MSKMHLNECHLYFNNLKVEIVALAPQSHLAFTTMSLAPDSLKPPNLSLFGNSSVGLNLFIRKGLILNFIKKQIQIFSLGNLKKLN